MGHIKLKSILAENMRRFRTKNLNEAILSDTFYIHYENENSNSMNFTLQMPQSTTLKDPTDTQEYLIEDPNLDMILYELLGYDKNEKESRDNRALRFDDYMSIKDNWYTFLQDMAKEAGLTVNGADDDDEFEEGDEWKYNLDSDEDEDEDEDDEVDERFSKKPVRKTLRLHNGVIVDVTFIKGASEKSNYLNSMEAIYKCVVRGARRAANQSMN
jgi:hypothetical protein